MLHPICLHDHLQCQARLGDAEVKEWHVMQGIKVTEWNAFLELGKGKPTEPVPPKPNDPATIMYTSGTTGGLNAISLAVTMQINHAAVQESCSNSLHVPSTETHGITQSLFCAF